MRLLDAQGTLTKIIKFLDIIKKIGNIWEKDPDQRFCQLLINLGLISDNFEDWIKEDNILEEILDKNGKM